jgi:hypothetical protein
VKCHCGKDMLLISSYDNPDVAAGHRSYQCKDHLNYIERTMWYCPYIPLALKDVPTPTNIPISMRTVFRD